MRGSNTFATDGTIPFWNTLMLITTFFMVILTVFCNNGVCMTASKEVDVAYGFVDVSDDFHGTLEITVFSSKILGRRWTES